MVWIAAWSAFAADPDGRTYRIGVLAYRGDDHARRSWQPTAAFLGTAIRGAKFEVVPLPLAALRRHVAERRVAFVFTNSGQYVELEADFGLTRIATVKSPFGQKYRNVFGAVIFARADNPGIKKLGDLKGKSFAAVKPGAFGGFQMAWRELKAVGIDPFTDFARIDFVGLPQDRIVFAVRDHQVDAGTVRTDVLETMAVENGIELSDFHILNPQSIPGHDVRLSTRLYPEWPFATMPQTPTDLSEKVAIALLNLASDSGPVRAMGSAGWTVPLDYKPVHDMFRELEIGPYTPGAIGLREIIKQHWQWLAIALVIVLSVASHGVWTEFLVKRRTRELSEANLELEREVSVRRAAEERARRHQADLAHLSRVSVISEMTSGLAHELRQPLAAINNYAEGGIRRIRQRNGEAANDILQALENINEQASRAGQIISRVRGYLQKQSPKHGPVDVNHAIGEAAVLIGQEARNQGVTLRLDLANDLPAVSGDLIEIEQLVINLAKNAIDAMAEVDWSPRNLTISTRAISGGIRVEVLDTGPGLSRAGEGDAFHTQIWQPFFSSKLGGLGLGLAICRTIVDMHAGRIWSEPRKPQGTALIFELPRPPAAEHEAGHA